MGKKGRMIAFWVCVGIIVVINIAMFACAFMA